MTTPIYRAVRNAIVDQDGKQVAVVMPANCTQKLANEMAAYAAQQANHYARGKTRRAQTQGET
jgi:hypothetical protein